MTEQQPPAYPPAFPPAWAPVVVRPRVPGTVRAAAIVTYLCAGASTALTLLFALGALFVGSVMIRFFEWSDRVVMVLVVGIGVLVSLALGAAACLLAWQTTQRKNWARYGLAVFSAVAAVLSVLTVSPVILLGVPSGIAVLVLLFVPETNAWFNGAGGN